MEIEEISELLKHFQRDINCLMEEDRNLKKKGLTSLMNDLFKESVSPLVSLEIFQKHVLKYLVKLFDDKIEKHREFVLNLLEKYFTTVAANKQYLEKDCLEIILKGLLQRLNTIPYNEPSEELRLKILQLITKIVTELPEGFIPLISEYSFMLVKILSDSSPDSKKEAAHLIVVSSEKLRKTIGYHSNPILKALAVNSNHQHSKVRKATLEAICSLILAEGAGPNLEAIYNSLKLLINDKTIDVRKTAVESVCKMINGLSLTNLRESEAKLVYLALTGLSDENEDIVKTTMKLLEDVGEKRKLLSLEFGEIGENC